MARWLAGLSLLLALLTTAASAAAAPFVYVANEGISAPTGPGSVSRYGIGAAGLLAPQPRLPTSKDQCKNGGWQTSGLFKNQGQCISFVNHPQSGVIR